MSIFISFTPLRHTLQIPMIPQSMFSVSFFSSSDSSKFPFATGAALRTFMHLSVIHYVLLKKGGKSLPRNFQGRGSELPGMRYRFWRPHAAGGGRHTASEATNLCGNGKMCNRQQRSCSLHITHTTKGSYFHFSIYGRYNIT